MNIDWSIKFGGYIDFNWAPHSVKTTTNWDGREELIKITW